MIALPTLDQTDKAGDSMSRLTEQEQQEVFRLFEADKRLSDRYRFLLFEDKREIELV